MKMSGTAELEFFLFSAISLKQVLKLRYQNDVLDPKNFFSDVDLTWENLKSSFLP